jgi:threonine/homoserine/homoserine lactone efflux protein
LLAYILQSVGYGFIAAMQPGPFQTFIVSQTLSRGWRRTMPMVLAPLISDGPIIVLMTLVLSQVPAWLQRMLHILSGLFILYLAYGAWIAWRRFDGAALLTAQPSRYNLIKAATVNAISPGPYLYWGLVTGPILVSGWDQAPVIGIGFLVGFYGAMLSSIAAIILIFDKARQLGPSITRTMLGISAVLLFGFGLYQLAKGVLGNTSFP